MVVVVGHIAVAKRGEFQLVLNKLCFFSSNKSVVVGDKVRLKTGSVASPSSTYQTDVLFRKQRGAKARFIAAIGNAQSK